MPAVRIDSKGMGGDIFNFKKPIPIGKGRTVPLVFRSDDEVMIEVKGKKGDRILYSMNVMGKLGKMRLSLAHSGHPKGLYASAWYDLYPRKKHSEIDMIAWTETFGGMKVNDIMDIPVDTDIDLTTQEGQLDALDLALDILLPGTRGALTVGYNLRADTGITLGAGKPIVRQIKPVNPQAKPWKKEVLDETQARIDELLKKKPQVSDEVVPEAAPTTEPTITKDAVKATKKVPFKKPTTPNVWQILTSEVQQIFDLTDTTLSKAEQKNLDTFIESLGSVSYTHLTLPTILRV